MKNSTVADVTFSLNFESVEKKIRLQNVIQWQICALLQSYIIL